MSLSASLGAGKIVSSGPWLWIATGMPLFLTAASMAGRRSGLGAMTRRGKRAALAYSKRAAISFSFPRLLFPLPTILRPASSNSLQPAAS